MRTRTFLVGGLVVALIIAGFATYYGSAHPDGLEYVAERAGFLGAAEDSVAAGGPLADYTTRGVADARLSGGLAGVIGTLVVLLLAGGLGYAVRRRSAPLGAGHGGRGLMGAGHGQLLHYPGDSQVHRAPAHWKVLALLAFVLAVVATPRAACPLHLLWFGLLATVVSSRC